MQDNQEENYSQTFYFKDKDQYELINDLERPELNIFPNVITLQGYREVIDDVGKTIAEVTVSMYMPIKESYEDNGTAVKLDYQHMPSKDYGIRIIFHKPTQDWVADKYYKQESFDRYHATSLDWLMTHLLVCGYK